MSNGIPMTSMKPSLSTTYSQKLIAERNKIPSPEKSRRTWWGCMIQLVVNQKASQKVISLILHPLPKLFQHYLSPHSLVPLRSQNVSCKFFSPLNTCHLVHIPTPSPSLAPWLTSSWCMHAHAHQAANSSYPLIFSTSQNPAHIQFLSVMTPSVQLDVPYKISFLCYHSIYLVKLKLGVFQSLRVKFGSRTQIFTEHVLNSKIS